MNFSIRLSNVHRWILYIVWTVMSCTGLYFAYAQDWQMQDPSQITLYTLKIHGIFAALIYLLIGSLFSVHIKLSLHRKRNVFTGLLILSVMLLLAFSGTALYYSPEDWNHNVKWLYIWVGLFSVILLPIHILIGRKLRVR